MTRPVLLNNVDHHDLRLRDLRKLRVGAEGGAADGDGTMLAHTFPAEFRNLQAHYPIVFQKSADGTSFHPVALLGLEPGQNLFLGDTGWDASYLPLAIERGPFYIGLDGGELLVHADLDSPLLSRTDGAPLFLPMGGQSDTLDRITSVLLAIHGGLQATPAFIQDLLANGLLESFVLDLSDDDGTVGRLAGFYTIHEEALAALPGPALADLHAKGHLEPVYMAVASLSNFRALIDRRQRARLQRGG